ncbi:hypothetical protein ACQKNS_19945 [Peribacillus sp. NPDC094092]|uniref:hypothetical protein n=1 Tax=Peribacillus sp. NPDC094092 TaxID=3390611 RepID=UPI003D00C5D8
MNRGGIPSAKWCMNTSESRYQSHSKLSNVIIHTLLRNGKQGQILIPKAFHEEKKG